MPHGPRPWRKRRRSASVRTRQKRLLQPARRHVRRRRSTLARASVHATWMRWKPSAPCDEPAPRSKVRTRRNARQRAVSEGRGGDVRAGGRMHAVGARTRPCSSGQVFLDEDDAFMREAGRAEPPPAAEAEAESAPERPSRARARPSVSAGKSARVADPYDMRRFRRFYTQAERSLPALIRIRYGRRRCRRCVCVGGGVAKTATDEAAGRAAACVHGAGGGNGGV